MRRFLPVVGLLVVLGLSFLFVGSAPATPSFTLTVTKVGTGAGTVTSSPAGINCGPTCSAAYSKGTVVSLAQSADPGSVFAGWSGACSGSGSCSVAVNNTKSVTATFNTQPTTCNFVTSIASGSTYTLGNWIWGFDPACNRPVAAGQFWADGTQLNTITGPPPYNWNVSCGALGAGTHTLGHSWDLADGTHMSTGVSYSNVTIVDCSASGQVVYGYNFADPVAIPPGWGWGDSNNTLALDTSTFWSAPASARFTVQAGTYRAELFSPDQADVICNRCDYYYNLTYMIPSGFNIQDGAGISHLLQINQESMQGNSSGAILVTLGTKIAGAASQPWLGIVSEGGDQRLFPNGDYYSGSPQWAGSCGQCRPAGWPGAPFYIQGPGTIAAGQWYQVVIHVHWTTDSDGVLEVWLRPKGGTLAKVVDLGPVGHSSQFNFPTLEWGYQTTGCGGQLYDTSNIDGLRNCTADEPGQYVGNHETLTASVTVWEDNFCKATSFDVAQSC